MFSKLQDKINARKVSNVLSKRYVNRKGGYSRIIKAGFRSNDKAPLAIIELVDRDANARKVDKKKQEKKEIKSQDKDASIKQDDKSKKLVGKK